MQKLKFIFITLLSVFTLLAFSKNDIHDKTLGSQGIILSAIKGSKSKTGKIKFKNGHDDLNDLSLKIEGEHADFFVLESKLEGLIKANTFTEIAVYFYPSDDFIGIAEAQIVLNHDANSKITFPLRGLSTKALEGKNEPPLLDVVKTLNYKIDLGWSTLGHHTKSDLQGDEIAQTLFKKANSGEVEMIPMARYSPPFELPFGYYTQVDNQPQVFEVGVLSGSKKYPEHQTLSPSLKTGTTVFDPGKKAFGFYTKSPTHEAYSEDVLNTKLHPKNVAHACRIYPVKNAEGKLLKNQYLVCFEEASNGDYQDYVFLVKNIKPN